MSQNERRLSIDMDKQPTSEMDLHRSLHPPLHTPPLVHISMDEYPAPTCRTLFADREDTGMASTTPRNVGNGGVTLSRNKYPETQLRSNPADSEISPTSSGQQVFSSSSGETLSPELVEFMPSVPLEISSIDDSLDADDIPYSQEHSEAHKPHQRSKSSSESEESDVEVVMAEEELQNLRPLTDFVATSKSFPLSAQAVSEDHYSGSFHGTDDRRWVTFGDSIEKQEDSLRGKCSAGDEPCERAAHYQDGGIDSWEYTSPFADIDVFLMTLKRYWWIDMLQKLQTCY